MKKSKDGLGSFFQRVGSETPPFFKKLRLIGLVVVAAGTTIVASPIALPTLVTTIGGYLIVAGSVATAMSQAAISEDSGEGE